MARTGRVSRPFEAVANLDEWLAAEDVDRLAGVGYERLWAVLRKKRPRTAFRHLGRTVLEASPPPTRRRRVVRGPNRVAWLREAALSLQASTWAVEMAGQWVGRLGADTAEGELDQAARQLSLAAHSGAIDPEEAKALQRQATAALARVLEREAELGRLLVEGRRALRPLASDAAAARTDPGWWLRSEQVDRVLTDIDQFQTFASAVEGARPDLLATGVSPAEVRQVASDARARQDFLRRIRAIQTLILVLSLRMDHALPEVVRQTVADLLAGEGDAAEATRVARGVARLVPQILALVEQERGAAFFPVSAPSASAYVGLSQASGARTAYRGARIAPERMPGPPSAVATRAGADGD